jgi:hypothetical protein
MRGIFSFLENCIWPVWPIVAQQNLAVLKKRAGCVRWFWSYMTKRTGPIRFAQNSALLGIEFDQNQSTSAL